MNAHASQGESFRSTREQVVKQRIEGIGWGLLLLITGGVFLLPDQHLAEVAWLIGVGLVLLGANAVRYLNGIRMGTVSFALGIVALAGGLGGIFGLDLPLFPILLILMGAGLLIGSLFEREA